MIATLASPTGEVSEFDVRQVLNDVNDGSDILNASAVISDLLLDLTPGSQTSMIAGRHLSLGAETLIESSTPSGVAQTM